MTNISGKAPLGSAGVRPSNSRLYPWYDSVWLSKYEEAKTVIRTCRPEALRAFVDAFRILHTHPDFKVKFLEQPFDSATLAEIRRITAKFQPKDLELHEAKKFGRFVVHNHPFFKELQQRTVPYGWGKWWGNLLRRVTTS